MKGAISAQLFSFSFSGDLRLQNYFLLKHDKSEFNFWSLIV